LQIGLILYYFFWPQISEIIKIETKKFQSAKITNLKYHTCPSTFINGTNGSNYISSNSNSSINLFGDEGSVDVSTTPL